METNKIYQGDCITEMKKLPENSIDAIITDPPYGLEFMGKEWDKFKQGKNVAGGTTGIGTPFGRSKPLNSAYQYGIKEKNQLQQFCYSWAKECLRVLKPGGFLLSFGGTRTYHRMVCGIEDAGFEIRDMIEWFYGSGFPKSLNIGKQVDKIRGKEREIIGKENYSMPKADNTIGANSYGISGGSLKNGVTAKRIIPNITKGNSKGEGWGTSLKPSHEPICVARKPLSEKNVALNVLKWGTGGINIDESRIGFKNELDEKESKGKNQHSKYPNSVMRNPAPNGIYHQDKRPAVDYTAKGRFPANLILDEEAGKMLDEQTIGKVGNGHWAKTKITGFGKFGGGKSEYFGVGKKDKSKAGASRFFYCAKASKSERQYGLGREYEIDNSDKYNGKFPDSKADKLKNNHPTVKPIKLMEYLIKLVSKENAIILDPFLGSGTTAIACLKLNRKFIGIEKEPEYVEIAKARIKPFLEQRKLK